MRAGEAELARQVARRWRREKPSLAQAMSAVRSNRDAVTVSDSARTSTMTKSLLLVRLPRSELSLLNFGGCKGFNKRNWSAPIDLVLTAWEACSRRSGPLQWITFLTASR